MTATGSAFDLKGYLESERNALEAARRPLLDSLLAGVPESVAAPIRYALDAGGKRLRPILCVAAYRAVAGAAAGETAFGVGDDARGGVGGDAGGGAGDRAADAAPDGAPVPAGLREIACAIELIHTYSLVHDDLPCMDDDDLRRGRPTTHRVFGEARAIVAGAALIPLAARAVRIGAGRLGLDGRGISALVLELLRAAGGGGMVGGQLLDLMAEGREVDVAALEAIHRRKTGALLAAPPRIGGIAAGAAQPVVTALGEYGRGLGLAFQIADDVLDVTASTTTLGKTAGRDRALAKATYPTLLGVDGARERAAGAAGAAIAALRSAGIHSAPLEALASYAADRDR